MAFRKTIKRILLIPALLVGTVLVLLTLANFLIRYNAKDILHDLVARESNGFFELKMQKISLNYSDSRIDIVGVRLEILDSTKRKILHVIKIPEFIMDLEEWGRLLLRKELLIDSLICDFPQVDITGGGKRRRDESGKEITLSSEIGDIYLVIRDIVNALQVKNLRIRRGGFEIQNPGQRNDKTDVKEINLGITNLLIDSNTAGKKGRFLFSDDIHVDAGGQEVVFPDSLHFFKFRYLDISTKNKKILLDSCTILNISKEGKESNFSIFVQEIRLVNFDFNTLYENDVIKADSIYCSSPSIRLNLVQQDKEGPNKKFTEKVLKQLVGNMDVAYIGVINADLDLHAHGLQADWSLSLSQNNFEIFGIYIDNKTESPIQIDRVKLAFKNYRSYLADSLYTSTFDSVLLNESRLVVKNFKLSPVIEKNPYGHTVVIPEVVLKDFALDQLLFEDRLQASSVTFVEPLVEFKLMGKSRIKEHSSINELSSMLEEGISINQLFLERGTLKLSGQTSSMPELTIADITGEISPERLLKARDVNSRLGAVRDLSFYSIGVRKGDVGVGLSGVEMDEGLRRMTAKGIEISDQQDRFMFRGTGAIIDGIRFSEETQSLSLDRFEWESGSVIFRSSDGTTPSALRDTGSFYLGTVRLKDTRFQQVSKAGNNFQAYISLLQARELRKNGRDPVKMSDLMVKGESLDYRTGKIQLSAKTYDLRNGQLSNFTGLDFNFRQKDLELSGKIPRLSFQSTFLKSIFNSQNKETGKPTPATIGYFNIEDAVLNGNWKREDKFISFNTSHAFIQGDGILNAAEEIRIRRALLRINGFELNQADPFQVDGKNAILKMEIRDLIAPVKKGQDSLVGATIVDCDLDHMNLKIARSTDPVGMEAEDLHTKFVNLVYDGRVAGNWLHRIVKAPGFRVRARRIHLPGDQFRMDFDKVEMQSEGGIFKADSFNLSIPKIRIDDIREAAGINGYLQARAGNIAVSGMDWERYARDSVLKVKDVMIRDLYVNTGRLLPPARSPDFVKPLPAKGWKRRERGIAIENITIRNSHLDYEILDATTGQKAEIFFNRGQIRLQHLKNFDFSEKDTLKLEYRGYLKDSVFVRLRYHEFYQDTLSPFTLNLDLGPFDFTVMNSMLVPMAAVRIRSGIADTLHMEVAGNDYLALGRADFYYKNLSVDFLKESTDSTKKKRVKGFQSFIANNLLIKSNNFNRSGVVFSERLRTRGIINYAFSMLASGLTTSLGVKSNNEIKRKYYRSLKKGKPPVE